MALRARQRGALTVAVTALRRAAELSEQRGRPRHGACCATAELAFELGRGELITELLALTDPALLGEPERARLAWLNEMREEGRNEGPQRVRRLIVTAEERERARATGPWHATSSARPRCAAGGAIPVRSFATASSRWPNGWPRTTTIPSCWSRWPPRRRWSGPGS
ncbi:hypothetical protein GCM10020220_071400 [Nonomuraea rubra]|uniref:hypothetical protein n=1 Tax=Nonomuraea rubra TaxID=46180 RepID=UPI0031EE36AB